VTAPTFSQSQDMNYTRTSPCRTLGATLRGGREWLYGSWQSKPAATKAGLPSLERRQRRPIPSGYALDRIVLKILEQEVDVVQFVEESIVILEVKQAAICLSLYRARPNERGTISSQFECRTRKPG
jgi:hypothetical protein